jgi:hypothetical protein
MPGDTFACGSMPHEQVSNERIDSSFLEGGRELVTEQLWGRLNRPALRVSRFE